MEIDKTQPTTQKPLTATEKAALGQLHSAAKQFEGVFLDMLFKSMRETVPKESIFGQDDNAQDTFQSMLDEQRSQDVAQNGSFGIARVLEEQLKQSVLANADKEAKTNVPETTP